MEGYPYIQKVSSPYAAFQENASNPDKSTINGSLEQPVYEQLMPSTLVVVNPYRYEAGIPSASNSVESTIVAPQTASCSGTYNIDPCSTVVVGSNSSLHNLAPERTPQYVPPVLNGQQASNITNVSDKHSFAGGESTVCNGASEDLLKDNPIPDKSCLTTLTEQTSESTLKRDDENIVPPNEKITMSTKEVDVHNSSKAIGSIEPIQIITGTNACNKPYASAISNETSVKDNANHVQAPGTIDSASAEEKLVESNPDEDENSSDSTKSNSYTEAQHSENVSSLFKNVVLVQAHTIAAEENDSMDRVTSASEVNSFNETDAIDPIVTSSVEDIGREDEPMEHEMMDPAGLLIDETGDVQNFEIMEGVAVGQMGQIVALDAPIIDPTMMEEPENDADNVILNEETNTDGNGSGKGLSGKENSSNVSVKQCKQLDTVSLSSGEETSEGCKDESQKCQMRKRGVIRVVNVKKELLKKRSKTSERSASNDDPFGSCASSSSEDVPNDMYFGSPDRVYTVSTKLHWQRQKQKRNKYYSREKSTDQYSDASSDNEEKEHTQRRAKKAEEIARLQLPAYHQQQLQELVLKKHPKRGRFYDRSQDIPNDIYFGNVKVPLHILHATSSSSSEEEPWPGGSAKSATSSNSCHRKESTTYAKSSNNRYSKISSSRAESTSTYGSVRSVHRMKEYLKMAGFRHMRYQKLWQGCETNHERAEAILRFLQTHGLQGEPTDEKCRELRKQIQLQKEVEVLDTSVIIGSGEGRVTRQRTKKVSEPTAVAPDVNLSSKQSLPKEEETIESAAATETTELETECVQQQEQQQQDGNVPLENRVEHALPAAECANRSNTPSIE